MEWPFTNERRGLFSATRGDRDAEALATKLLDGHGYEMTIDDLVRALREFPSYRAIVVFAHDVDEVRQRCPVAGLSQLDSDKTNKYRLDRDNDTYMLELFPNRGVLRLTLLTIFSVLNSKGQECLNRASWPTDLSDAKPLASTEAVIHFPVCTESEDIGHQVGILVGMQPNRIFIVEFKNEWVAYDGGLVHWLKEHLLLSEPPGVPFSGESESMPHIVGPENALPRRPFNLSMIEDVTLLGNVLDELQVYRLEVSMPRSCDNDSKIDYCYIRIHTSLGAVEASRKTFVEAFMTVVAAVETLRGSDSPETTTEVMSRVESYSKR